MGKLLEGVGPTEEAFIAKQKVFFVATAPLSADHHVNVSPKAPGGSVVVLGPKRVAYADLSGSGAEAAAHVLENQRMTLMFCNLEEGPPKILRIYGKAEMVIKEDVDPQLLQKFPESITTSFGFRCVFILDVDRVTSSCGYSLPVMTYQKTRKILDEYTENKGEEGMKEYCIYKNSFSIDGLPSVAHLRNKGATIIPDPKEGYIFGEKVSKDDPRASQVVLPNSRQLKNAYLVTYGALLFVAGVAIGTFLPRGKVSMK